MKKMWFILLLYGIVITTGKGEETIPDWQARWELARLLSYSKNYDEAQKEFSLVLQEQPELWEARVDLARIFYWRKSYPEALRELRIIPAERLSDEGRLLLADLYRLDKRYTEAAPLYQTYLAAKPNDDEARLHLAEILSWSKRYEQSLVEYKKLINKRPNDIQLQRKYAQLLIWAGHPQEAAELLRKTLPRK